MVKIKRNYGILLGRGVDERETIAEVQIDGCTKTCFLEQQEFVYLMHDPFFYWVKSSLILTSISICQRKSH
jgi:hypothetical protein